MNRDLVLIAASLFTWGIGESMFYDFRPLYLQSLGADPLVIGGIMGMIGAAMAFSHLPAGYLADRLGRRPLIIAAWVLGIIATLMMVLANDLWLFSIGAIIYGATFFVSGPLNGYISSARGSLSVGRSLTFITAFFSLGGVIGPLIGGWLADRMGLRSVLFIASLWFVLSTVIIFFIHPQPVQQLAKHEQIIALKQVFSPHYVRFIAIIFLVVLVMYLPQPFSPIFLQNERGVSLSQIGQMISLGGLGVVFFNLVLGHIKARWGFYLAQIIMLLFSLLIWQGQGMLWYLGAYFCMGSFRTARSLAAAQGREFLHEANMGIGFGIMEGLIAIAMIVAPPVAGLLYEHQPLWIYQLTLVMAMLALIVSFIWLPHNEKEDKLLVS